MIFWETLKISFDLLFSPWSNENNATSLRAKITRNLKTNWRNFKQNNVLMFLTSFIHRSRHTNRLILWIRTDQVNQNFSQREKRQTRQANKHVADGAMCWAAERKGKHARQRRNRSSVLPTTASPRRLVIFFYHVASPRRRLSSRVQESTHQHVHTTPPPTYYKSIVPMKKSLPILSFH